MSVYCSSSRDVEVGKKENNSFAWALLICRVFPIDTVISIGEIKKTTDPIEINVTNVATIDRAIQLTMRFQGSDAVGFHMKTRVLSYKLMANVLPSPKLLFARYFREVSQEDEPGIRNTSDFRVCSGLLNRPNLYTTSNHTNLDVRKINEFITKREMIEVSDNIVHYRADIERSYESFLPTLAELNRYVSIQGIYPIPTLKTCLFSCGNRLYQLSQTPPSFPCESLCGDNKLKSYASNVSDTCHWGFDIGDGFYGFYGVETPIEMDLDFKEWCKSGRQKSILRIRDTRIRYRIVGGEDLKSNRVSIPPRPFTPPLAEKKKSYRVSFRL